MEAKKWFTFDDVALLPCYSELESRTTPNLQTKLTTTAKVSLPFIPSPMSSVIGLELGKQLVKHQIYPIFHRFYNSKIELEDWINEIGEQGYISWGLDELDLLIEILRNPIGNRPKGVCFDVAHGHCKKMRDAIEIIKCKSPDSDVIAGAVCEPMAAVDLVRWGADAIRVGIGAGSACTTRLVTGFGAPQFSAIHECSLAVKRFSNVPIIADGGIRNSRDIALALAAGASTVMLGKLFAATKESAAEYRSSKGYTYPINPLVFTTHKLYKGQASTEFQKPGRAAEGDIGLVEVKGTVDELLQELSENLRSALSYAGALTIGQFHERARWVEVTQNYWDESQTRFDQ